LEDTTIGWRAGNSRWVIQNAAPAAATQITIKTAKPPLPLLLTVALGRPC
jgi:hypothetical protein